MTRLHDFVRWWRTPAEHPVPAHCGVPRACALGRPLPLRWAGRFLGGGLPVGKTPSGRRASATVGPSAVLLAFVVLAAWYSVTIPLGEAPDEVPHFTYVRYLAQHGRLPTTQEEHEAFQPPLYYALGAALTFWINDEPDVPFAIRANADYDVLDPAAPKNLLLHTAAEGWPYRGWALAWHLVRLVSITLGAVTVWAVYRLGRVLFPGETAIPLAMAALTAFTPQFLFMSAVANNDNAAVTFSALVLWQVAALLHEETCVGLPTAKEAACPPQRKRPAHRKGSGLPSAQAQGTPQCAGTGYSAVRRHRVLRRRSTVLGLLVGLGMLSKANLIALVPIAGLAILISNIKCQTPAFPYACALRSTLCLRTGQAASFAVGRPFPWWWALRPRAERPAEYPVPAHWAGRFLGGVLPKGRARTGSGKGRHRISLAVCCLLLAGGLAFLVAGWYFLRNWRLFGDPLGWSFLLEINARREGPLTIGVLSWLFKGVFRSFWLGWIGIAFDQAVYWLIAGVCAVGVLGFVGWLVGRWRELGGATRWTLALLGLHLAVTLGSLVQWTATVLGTDQGRLIFPVLPTLMLILIGGWAWWARGRARCESWLLGGLVAGMLTLSILTPIRYIAPVHAPAPVATSAELAAATPINVDWTGVRLLAYRLGRAEVRPGGKLELDLYWQGIQPLCMDCTEQAISRDLMALIQLVDGEGKFVMYTDGSPTAGRDTTDRWRAGVPLASRHLLRLPEYSPPGDYHLTISLHPFGQETWLPAVAADGSLIGDQLVLPATIRVVAP